MSDDDNKPRKKPLNRRSFMASVLGGAAVAGGASSLIAGEAQAQQRPTGRSDSDSGSYADRGGYGRTGMTDSDPYDRAGYGSDPAGRGYSGRTDSDSGSNRDRAGHGRGPARG